MITKPYTLSDPSPLHYYGTKPKDLTSHLLLFGYVGHTGRWTFGDYAAWDATGPVTPPPGHALTLLHRLAADPGIVAIMERNQWRVGRLSEMPPEGEFPTPPAKHVVGWSEVGRLSRLAWLEPAS